MQIIINIDQTNSAQPSPHIYMVLPQEKIDAAEAFTDKYMPDNTEDSDTPFQACSEVLIQACSGVSTFNGTYVMHFLGKFAKEEGRDSSSGVRSVILDQINDEALDALHMVWANDLRKYEEKQNGQTFLKFREGEVEFCYKDTGMFLHDWFGPHQDVAPSQDEPSDARDELGITHTSYDY